MIATVDASSRTEQVLIVQRTLTPAKVLEEGQARNAESLARIIDEFPDAVCLVNAEGRIEYCNSRCQQLLGPCIGELLEQLMNWKLHPDDLECWLTTWRNAHQHLEHYAIEHRLAANPHQRYCWFRHRGVPLVESGGTSGRWLLQLTWNDEPKSREKELQALLSRKDDFLATLLHELRNPLAPVANALEMLARRPDDPATVLGVRDIIGRQLKQLTRLVEDLLDFSRTGRGMVDLKLQSVDVCEVVAQAVETARPVIEKRHHNLAQLSQEERYLVEGDAARLAQVVTNLLINAAKYTAPGGSITIMTEGTDQEITVRVRDSGVGIPREHLEHIFEPFTQERSSSDAHMGGLGIGLAVAKQLISLHGGSIRAESQGVGRGSEFCITLPRLAAH